MVTLKLWHGNAHSSTVGSQGSPGDKGRSLPAFEVLGAEWVGQSVRVPFGADRKRSFDIVGWSERAGGQAVSVHVVKVSADGRVGFLVYGGDGGVRIVDQAPDTGPEPGERLAGGHAAPLVWVSKIEDLPVAVQEVVAHPICQRCGKELSPSDAQDVTPTFCEQCQASGS